MNDFATLLQQGNAWLFVPSAILLGALHGLEPGHDRTEMVAGIMREVGPISPDAPAFPHAATALGPLKAAAEKLGRVDFTNLWAGQAVRMSKEMPAAELTRALAGAALARMAKMAG